MGVCQPCTDHVPCLDLRDRSSEPLLDVAALGLVHLDVPAQQHGFLPLAASACILVTHEGAISSASDIGALQRSLERKLNS